MILKTILHKVTGVHHAWSNWRVFVCNRTSRYEKLLGNGEKLTYYDKATHHTSIYPIHRQRDPDRFHFLDFLMVLW